MKYTQVAERALICRSSYVNNYQSIRCDYAGMSNRQPINKVRRMTYVCLR